MYNPLLYLHTFDMVSLPMLKQMTASDMGKKAQENRRKKMTKQEISDYYKWVVSHRKNVQRKRYTQSAID